MKLIVMFFYIFYVDVKRTEESMKENISNRSQDSEYWDLFRI